MQSYTRRKHKISALKNAMCLHFYTSAEYLQKI